MQHRTNFCLYAKIRPLLQGADQFCYPFHMYTLTLPSLKRDFISFVFCTLLQPWSRSQRRTFYSPRSKKVISRRVYIQASLALSISPPEILVASSISSFPPWFLSKVRTGLARRNAGHLYALLYHTIAPEPGCLLPFPIE